MSLASRWAYPRGHRCRSPCQPARRASALELPTVKLIPREAGATLTSRPSINDQNAAAQPVTPAVRDPGSLRQSVFPLLNGVQGLTSQNVTREVSNMLLQSLITGLARHRSEGLDVRFLSEGHIRSARFECEADVILELVAHYLVIDGRNVPAKRDHENAWAKLAAMKSYCRFTLRNSMNRG